MAPGWAARACDLAGGGWLAVLSGKVHGSTLATIAIVGGLLLVVVLVIMHTIRKVTETRERERTRREIAAYLAEGSITADDAARLLSAGMTDQVAAELAKGVAWGTVSAEKARKMVEALQTPHSGSAPGVTPERGRG